MSTTAPAAVPAPTIRPSFAAINLHSTTLAQLARNIGGQLNLQYSAILVHCLLFDSAGRTLLLRHTNPLTTYVDLHKADAWCSPHVTCELYLDASEPTITLSIAKLVERDLPCGTIPQTATLLCALSTTARLTEDGAQLPALVLAVGLQAIEDFWLYVPPTLCSDKAWVTEGTVGDGRDECKGLCRRMVFAEGVKQWRERWKAFDNRDGAWMVGPWEGEGVASSSG
ncbi:hypothetical protein LTR85_003510 [Meristemomyces frigidus]|nr:hypothetical protein LTR85_003510 [Meristemomyces frigidus]